MGNIKTHRIGDLLRLGVSGILDDELEEMLIEWINEGTPCDAATGSGTPQTIAQIATWLKTNSLVDWHGFEDSNFADWVLGYDDGGGWSRTTPGYHEASCGYLTAGTAGGLGPQKYHSRKWNIGTLGKEVRCELWVKIRCENGTAAERTVHFYLGVGDDTTPLRIKVASKTAPAGQTLTSEWVRFLIIFYQYDSSPFHREAYVFEWTGSSWAPKRGVDFGGAGDFSAYDYVWIRAEADAAKCHVWVDKLLVFKTKV